MWPSATITTITKKFHFYPTHLAASKVPVQFCREISGHVRVHCADFIFLNAPPYPSFHGRIGAASCCMSTLLSCCDGGAADLAACAPGRMSRCFCCAQGNCRLWMPRVSSGRSKLRALDGVALKRYLAGLTRHRFPEPRWLNAAVGIISSSAANRDCS